MIEACGNLVATREGVIGIVLLTALACGMGFGALGYIIGILLAKRRAREVEA